MHQTSNQCDQRNLQISSTITKAYPGLLLLGIVLACAALLAEHVKALESTQSAPASDARRDMIKALEASGPHPSLGEQARVFDRLVGTWDCDYSFYRDDGTVRHSKGELLVGWILDGRAVQDLFISYPANGEKERRIGTTIRFFDTALKQWRIIFISPQFNYVVTVQGGLEGDRIVLRGTDTTDGAPIRWSFNDIKPDSFVWRGEKTHDDGKTWKLEEEHHMKRRIGDTAKASTSEKAGPVEKPNSLLAFKQLTSLVGEWKGVQDKTEIKLKYTLIGNGSALMEESRPGTEAPMFTMFTVDGDHIIATHYCSMGNQPQMMTKTIADPSGKSLTFSLSHVYGLKTLGDWHNTGLTVTLEDTQHLTQVWTYEYNGKKGTNTFRFTRTL